MLAVVSLLLLCVGSADTLSTTFLAKTAETFKLAELQYAEVQIQAKALNFSVSRLLVDRSTGATLLQFANLAPELFEASNVESLPSSLRRCDWILEVIHQAENAGDFVKALRVRSNGDLYLQQGWVLDYLRLEDAGSDTKKSRPTTYSMKTLLCSVAQALPTSPALDPQQSTDSLLVVDVRMASGSMMILGRKMDLRTSSLSPSSMVENRWPQRPFPYSSAINQKAAEMIVDVLGTFLPKSALLLDPTCGSGTFLAFAMERGWRVEGYDFNSQCAQGTHRNLVYLFGEDQVQARAHVECKDSSHPIDGSEQPDCVVANLPWGVNSIEYADENVRILQSIRARLASGIPCAFVTRRDDSTLFSRNDFEIVAQAHIPPRDFQLPSSKKATKDNDADSYNGRNRCVVTFVVSR